MRAGSRFRPAPARILLLAVLVPLVAGCQLDIDVGIRVESDGSGAVTVAVGLDDDALVRIGDLERQLRVDDLRAAGWEVTGPTRDDDRTWVRATKGFATPEEATLVLAELTGPSGPFRDFVVQVDDSLFGTDYRVTGTVDLTSGPGAFGDEELSAALGGDPFGGTLQVIEQDEGRPVAEMVTFRVAVDLPGQDEPVVYAPSFADTEPTEVDAGSSTRNPLATVAIWLAVALVLVAAVVVLRRGFRRVSR